MKNLRRHFVLRLAVALCAHLALLPPGAWALCLGDQGHVAFEPTDASCVAASAACDDESCGPADCGGCEDTVVLAGVALKHASPRLDAPVPAAVLPRPAVTCPSGSDLRAPSPDARPEVPAPLAAATSAVRRC